LEIESQLTDKFTPSATEEVQVEEAAEVNPELEASLREQVEGKHASTKKFLL